MADHQQIAEGAGYQPVSGLAVAALVAGCCSVLVLITSLAAVVPLVAVAMAVAALADLRRAEGRKVGRLAALAGLALAIGFTAQAIAGGVVEHWIAGRRAEATARVWIDAVRQARFTEAVSCTNPVALPAPERDPAARPPSEADLMTAFQQRPAVAALAACGDARLAVRVERDAAVETGWVARVPLDGCGREGESLILRIAPRAAMRGGGLTDRWLVTGFDLGR